ncbi:MAG: hypothetical protein IKE93_09050 [Erysipelotrichaceae bacterium]|nr:hypothetical protein [Erysipelotrichaceae bacterium]
MKKIKELFYRKKTERQEDMNLLRQLRIRMTEAERLFIYGDISAAEYDQLKHDIMAQVVMLEEKYGE